MTYLRHVSKFPTNQNVYLKTVSPTLFYGIKLNFQILTLQFSRVIILQRLKIFLIVSLEPVSFSSQKVHLARNNVLQSGQEGLER